jgi:heat shock protein HtpX
MPDPSLLRSHPKTEQRVARLREMAAETRMGITTPAQWMGSEADRGPVTDRPRRRWHGMWY